MSWEIPNISYPGPLKERWEKALRRGSDLDRLVLLGQMLRYQPGSQGKVPAQLRVMLSKVGLVPVDQRGNDLVVRARPWKPEWLPYADQFPPLDPACQMEPRRQELSPLLADPVLRKVGYNAYRSYAQRTAIRSALTMPEGATLLVILPTGSGKSLCAQLPVAVEEEGLTVVVVPTVSLALDQERALEALSAQHPWWGSPPFAYEGGRSGEIEIRRQTIRQRIATGEQRILFCSPEALLSSLSRPLLEAARLGLLRRLIVDEAHMVDQWGESFRPSFQDLAGFRHALLEASPRPFQTVLLSATVTQGTLKTLKLLFGKPGPFGVMYAGSLRFEPTYWIVPSVPDETTKRRYLEEAIHLAPRPAILYVTRKEDALEWHRNLQEVGYKRLAVFTGDTPARQRREIVAKWRDRELDLVVATSAFGLGVDLPEVRSVLHACYPESLDRYYQEVGRSGRDGHASFTLIVYSKRDKEIARSLASRMYISVEKGFRRWKDMFAYAEPLGNDQFIVSLAAGPSVRMASKKNVYWNIRTLMLMQRAGLVEVLGIQGNEDDGVEANAYQKRIVRILEPRHLDEIIWKEKVEPVRQQLYQRVIEDFDRASEIEKTNEECLGCVFQRYYTLQENGIQIPSYACGGCPDCRQHGRHPSADSPPEGTYPWQSRLDMLAKAPLPEWLSGLRRIGVYYDMNDDDWREQVITAAIRLAYRGFLQVILPNDSQVWAERFYTASQHLPRLFLNTPSETPLNMPTQIILESTDTWRDSFEMKDKEAVVYIFPRTMKDPRQPYRLLLDRFATGLYTDIFDVNFIIENLL